MGGNTAPGSSIDYDFVIERYNGSFDSVFSDSMVNRLIVNYLNTTKDFGRRPDSGAGHQFPSIYLGGAIGGVGLEHPSYWWEE